MTKRDFIELYHLLNAINLILLFPNLFLISFITILYIYIYVWLSIILYIIFNLTYQLTFYLEKFRH